MTTTLTNTDRLRMNHPIPGIVTHDELADLWDLGHFYEEDSTPGKRPLSLYEVNEDYIEDRAREVWADKKGYKAEHGIPQKECTLCGGTGEHEDEDVESGTVICERCDGDGWEDINAEEIDAIADDPVYEKARTELENELIGNWQSAVEAVLDRFSADYDFQYESVTVHYPRDRQTQRMAYDGLAFRLTPVDGKTWKDVCDRLIDTMNGYGLFWYDDAKALKDVDSHPNYKRAALANLHILKMHGEVYGGRSCASVYQDSLENSMRSW